MAKVTTQVSLLVPFQTKQYGRVRLWDWLKLYWQDQLPGCEIVIGTDPASAKGKVPFSKTTAVNNAFKKSHGDIIVILDADAYLDAEVIVTCAARLRAQRKAHVRSWFVPYRHFYRLNAAATWSVISSDPLHPLVIPTPPPLADIEGTDGSGHGHLFGALIQIMPREAFILVGGMDPRFRGWGGEDVAFLHALDTLWGKHRNTPNAVFHMWHPATVSSKRYVDQRSQVWKVKMWDGQLAPRANDTLANRYHNARSAPVQMRQLVDTSRKPSLTTRVLDALTKKAA